MIGENLHQGASHGRIGLKVDRLVSASGISLDGLSVNALREDERSRCIAAKYELVLVRSVRIANGLDTAIEHFFPVVQ